MSRCANCGLPLEDIKAHPETRTESCLKELSEKMFALKTLVLTFGALPEEED